MEDILLEPIELTAGELDMIAGGGGHHGIGGGLTINLSFIIVAFNGDFNGNGDGSGNGISGKSGGNLLDSLLGIFDGGGNGNTYITL